MNLHPKLVSGSQWALKNNSISTVLIVTNTTVKEELQEKYPPQVVVITETGKVLSHTVEAFLSRRNYVGQSEFVSTLMEQILDGEPDGEEDSNVDIDDIDVGADAAFDSILGSVDSALAVDDNEDNSEDNERIPVFLPASHEGLSLDAHFVSYSEAPTATGSMHTFRFTLDDTLNVDHLAAIFSGKDAGVAPIGAVVVDGLYERVELQHYAYNATYIEVDPQGNCIARVFLDTPAASLVETTDNGRHAAHVEQPDTHIIPQISVGQQAVSVQPVVNVA